MSSFSELHKATLTPFVKDFKNAKNQKGRDRILEDSAAALRKSVEMVEDGSVKLPKDLKKVSLIYISQPCHLFSPFQAIGRFFKRSIEDEVDEDAEPAVIPKPKRRKQIYGLRDVVKDRYLHLVNAEIPHEAGGADYIANYQRAVTTVVENMEGDDLKEAEVMVEEWNKGGAPSDVQLK